MGFALEENELFPDAVKRLAIEQIELALDHLRRASEDLNHSVHATRQSLKRLRALVALLRSELGGEVFKREWGCYRSAGRLLANGRDAAAVVETFDALTRQFPGELAPEVFASERRFLEERRDEQLKLMVEEERAIEKVTDILTSARGRVESWPLKRAGFKAIRRDVRRSYRSGRQDLRSVVRHRTPANFHDWRRPVKLLWHQLQILTPIWPVILDAYAHELRNLSDRLNENHDLDLLRDSALSPQFEPRAHERAHELEALVSLIDRRCRELEAETLNLGERLYIERPRRFTDRIESYWGAWKRGSRESAVGLVVDSAQHPASRLKLEHNPVN